MERELCAELSGSTCFIFTVRKGPAPSDLDIVQGVAGDGAGLHPVCSLQETRDVAVREEVRVLPAGGLTGLAGVVGHTQLPLTHAVPDSVAGGEPEVLPVASLSPPAVPGGGDQTGAAPGQTARQRVEAGGPAGRLSPGAPAGLASQLGSRGGHTGA